MSIKKRNKKGNTTNSVKHYKMTHERKTYCGRKKYGYATSDLYKVMIEKEINCKNCLKKLETYGINNVKPSKTKR